MGGGRTDDETIGTGNLLGALSLCVFFNGGIDGTLRCHQVHETHVQGLHFFDVGL